jgi:integrase
MGQTFERVEKHLYKRQYQTAGGDWSTIFYARFTDWKGKRRIFPLGSDLKTAKGELKVLEARNIRKADFDKDKPIEEKTGAITFAEWDKKYPDQEGVKNKRSLNEEKGMIRLHLTPFFGSMLLTQIIRESLGRYIEKRMGETILRHGKASKKKVARGTVSNELSLLRRMLRVAAREGYQVSMPSFEGLIVRVKRGGRALTVEERPKVLAVYPKWLARLAEFATETCLSEGDLLRLTDEMIDYTFRVIVPEGGRMKTGSEQASPLTDRALQILEEIKKEKRSRASRSKIKGLIFTRDDGRPITRSMISDAVQKAVRDAKVKKYRFHDYRNTALTDWARRGVNVDIAMKASGHTSVQMHKRYLDLQREDVAKAFGILLQDGNMEKDEAGVEPQVADITKGEGRCPVVPLVFKTSLGIVRFPEGSTPSLLRQN